MAGQAEPATSPTARRRGRRPAGEHTKDALVAAARAVFAEQGYAGATVRAIAARAGVDPAMVNHWFGSKQGLFAAVLSMPFDPTTVVARALTGDLAGVPERMIRNFVLLWDQHDGGFAMVMHSVATQDLAARLITDYFSKEVFGQIVEAIGSDSAPIRAGLCASQILGLGIVRYVLKIEPLASADVDTVVAIIGPTIRRYLLGDLPSA